MYNKSNSKVYKDIKSNIHIYCKSNTRRTYY